MYRYFWAMLDCPRHFFAPPSAARSPTEGDIAQVEDHWTRTLVFMRKFFLPPKKLNYWWIPATHVAGCRIWLKWHRANYTCLPHTTMANLWVGRTVYCVGIFMAKVAGSKLDRAHYFLFLASAGIKLSIRTNNDSSWRDHQIILAKIWTSIIRALFLIL